MTSSVALLTTPLLSYGIIFLAEMGDKSQLVCMSLASKHRSKPIIIGAAIAFSLLNLLAVIFGGALSEFIAKEYLASAAIVVFVGFGLHSLLAKENENEENTVAKSTKSLVLTTFLMIFLAEFADKTQLAVMTMSTTNNLILIWCSATLALLSTTLIGIYAGRKVLNKININLINKLSGVLFIGIGLFMAFDLWF